MLGIYEKRLFPEGEKIWLGRYQNLVNVLHWHFECEIIRIVDGNARIKIGSSCFDAVKGDCFFCASKELHYIISEPDTQVDIMIIDDGLVRDITDKYTVLSPKIPDSFSIEQQFDSIKKELFQKERFYREALEIHGRGLIVDLFRDCQVVMRNDKEHSHKELVTKINNEFDFITFDDAVRYSGYSPSHFSKIFKTLSGMTFSDYLNIIRVENAIMLLRSDNNFTITSICLKCGFSSVRNFNRVFKKITGYSPSSLPEDYILDTGLHVSKTDRFDPTDKNSVLMQRR